MRVESEMAELHGHANESEDAHPGVPSAYGCPECGGVLWELHDGQLIRFRCRIGHAYSPDSLLAQQSEQLEDALWAALRALEEEHSLCLRLASRAAERGNRVVDDFRERAADAARRADLVRTVLEGTPNSRSGAPARASSARRKSVNGPAQSKDRS
jgi:two-component system chemotaxis response regulator CheB